VQWIRPDASGLIAGRTCFHGNRFMSHHYSGPDFGFPGGDARLDIEGAGAAGSAHGGPAIIAGAPVAGPSPMTSWITSYPFLPMER
jgi:hypothetical protein